ncbi:unnamed protein product [Paramecium octaurelia]|uniref:Uncharacterized protein n=1 Tax=Paramecium octaurelia TaxID=43137 RepID=A0A8S1V5Z6_PAROT|nr:unnamed protein product [Paramecium octaurelia]
MKNKKIYFEKQGFSDNFYIRCIFQKILITEVETTLCLISVWALRIQVGQAFEFFKNFSQTYFLQEYSRWINPL